MDAIKFKPLPNSVPEGTKTGDYFDLVCTFCLLKDGNVHLTQMGEIKAEEDKDEKPMFRKDYSDMAKSLQGDELQAGNQD